MWCCRCGRRWTYDVDVASHMHPNFEFGLGHSRVSLLTLFRPLFGAKPSDL